MDDRTASDEAAPWRTYPPLLLPTTIPALVAGGDGLWAGGVGGVARRGADGEWEIRGAGLPPAPTTALAPLGGALLAGGPGWLARSGDGGRAWAVAALPGTIGVVAAIAAAPAVGDDAVAIAATLDDGVLRTTDGGRRWEFATFGLESFEAGALVWVDVRTALAATDRGPYRSTNAGRSWRPSTGADGAVVAAFALLPDGTVVAATEEGGLLRSADGGASWLAAPAPPAVVAATALGFSPAGALLLGAPGRGILRSVDGGATWTLVHDDPALAFATVGGRVLAGTPTGVVEGGADGAVWHPLPAPPLHDLRRLLVLPPLGAAKDAVVAYGVHTPPATFRDGAGWLAWSTLAAPLSALAANPVGHLFAAGPDGLARSRDRGATWETVVPGAAGNAGWIAFRDGALGWAAAADGARLARTRDGGKHWDELPPPFPGQPVSALLATATAVLAATHDPARGVSALWRSWDDGATWERGPSLDSPWPAVAAGGEPPALALGDRLFLPRPDGRWERAPLPPAGPVRRVAGEGATLLALTTTGLWRSDDKGAAWYPLADSPPSAEITDIAVSRGTLYAILSGGRLRSRPA